MPIIQSSKRINPLDLDKNVEIGIAFPLDENNMFKGTENVRDQIKSNLLNLLLTYPGERINLPTFGIGLKKLLFEPNIDLEILKSKIQSQINRFIADIKLKNIGIEKSEDKPTVSLTLTYAYLLDNSPDTIQLNFR